MPSWRQCAESSFQGRGSIQFSLKLSGHREFCGLFELHFQSGLFRFYGLIDVRLYDRLQLNDFAKIGEPNLTRCLYVLGLLDKNTPGIF